MKKKYFYLLLIPLLTCCSYKVLQHQNVYQISKKGTNFYLIEENNQFLMVDSGTPNQSKNIEKVLLKNNINPKDIKYIIITHAHYDHAGNAKYFKDKYNTKIIIGKDDEEMLINQGEDLHLCPTNTLAKIGYSSTHKKRFESFTPDLFINKEFDLKDIGFTGRIFPLAGHTPGSLIIETDEQIFVGDLIRGSLLKSSKPKRHFYICDLEDNNQDIQEIYNLSKNKNWFVGHGGPLNRKSILEFLNQE